MLILGSFVEARDPYTGGHLWRVAQYARALGEDLGLEPDFMFRLTVGGVLHDVGKVGIPDNILRKRDALTDEEQATIKTHPKIGHDLLKDRPLGHLVLDVVTHHHEWVDGRGYPDGSAWDDLSLHSRIISMP